MSSVPRLSESTLFPSLPCVPHSHVSLTPSYVPHSFVCHSLLTQVIHGDLRSPNLLLDLTIDKDKPRFHVKIADFGLARCVKEGGGSEEIKVRIRHGMLWP